MIEVTEVILRRTYLRKRCIVAPLALVDRRSIWDYASALLSNQKGVYHPEQVAVLIVGVGQSCYAVIDTQCAKIDRLSLGLVVL